MDAEDDLFDVFEKRSPASAKKTPTPISKRSHEEQENEASPVELSPPSSSAAAAANALSSSSLNTPSSIASSSNNSSVPKGKKHDSKNDANVGGHVLKKSRTEGTANDSSRSPSGKHKLQYDAHASNSSSATTTAAPDASGSEKSRKDGHEKNQSGASAEASSATFATEDSDSDHDGAARSTYMSELDADLTSAGSSSLELLPVNLSSSTGGTRTVPALLTKVIDVDISDRCTHEVAILVEAEYVPLGTAKIPAKPAKEYPFTLDPFQREAVRCLEHHESVLVSAHTSAGKTVVAEYAIAMSLRDKQRCIYTTPIKALSNQKYRELHEEFQDVGLMTGDVTINPEASCLVMTTEILRSMLYRGSEVMREVAWVIFDEVHYMRDKERGVVWEETMILLPDNVHYVFLSATIPNAREFAQWICQLHKQPCHVVYTNFRPTPLQHYIFPSGGDGLFLVVDEKGEFREDNFAKAMSILVETPESIALAASIGGNKGGKRPKGPKGGPSDIYKIVKMIMERSYQPVIVFSFSKRECEAYALQMAKLDFNSDDEKQLVDRVFSNAIESLSEDDRKLPQVDHILPLLRRGIGIHHSGLLPILKEVIEILFQEGLLKALFATETFSMGLNMPAKTVVFTNVRKFDGKDFRWVSSGEYIQMSGRAGRRGLDERGIVILMVDEKMEPAVAKNLLKGEADPLNSAFHLSYNMILNLLRVEEINPEYMLQRSFYQFQNNAAIPKLFKKLQELEIEYANTKISNEDQVAEYYQIRTQLEKLKLELHHFVFKPQIVLPFIQSGRLAEVNDGADNWGWGCVVNFHKKAVNAKGQTAALDGSDAVVIVDMLVRIASDSKSQPRPRPAAENEKGEMQMP